MYVTFVTKTSSIFASSSGMILVLIFFCVKYRIIVGKMRERME